MIEGGAVVQVLNRTLPRRKPVWFMRQAGRYLPEYRELRAKHSMLELIRTPELAAQVTLQPLARFDLDAAIIFADILNPLIGMGAQLDFVEGHGPRIANPVRSVDDVERLVVPSVEENVSYTLEALRIVRAKLAPEIDLLGFAGAPFTLSCYLVEGGSLKELENLLQFMRSQPAAWQVLQDKLVELVSCYLVAQVKAGACAVQLFDSWVGALGPYEFDYYVAPYLRKILKRFRELCITELGRRAPIVYFSTHSAGLFPKIFALGFDAVSVDWRVSLASVTQLDVNLPLQGNLDPQALFMSELELSNRVRFCLSDSEKVQYHIFNLGHGILPGTPIKSIESVLSIVRGNDR